MKCYEMKSNEVEESTVCIDLTIREVRTARRCMA